MKTLLTLALMTAAIPASLLLAPSTAHAGTCGALTPMTTDLWAKYLSLPPMSYAAKASAMLSYWNQMIAWPWMYRARRLAYGTTLSGNVVGPTKRVFIADIPTDTNSVKIKLSKIGGKAKTSVTVCKVDASGNQVELWDITVPNGNFSDSWTQTVSGVQNQIVTVHLEGHSLAYSFDYKLKATKI